MRLRDRFFNALSKQDSITFSCFIAQGDVTIPILSVNDPYVNTDQGEFFVHWQDESPMTETWFDNIYRSGVNTLVVFESNIPDDATQDELGEMAKEGYHSLFGDVLQVYSRVY